MVTEAKVVKKVNEVVQSYCHNSWCILKEIIYAKYSDGRFLVQLQAISHRKYELSEKYGYDIGWEAANIEWVQSGCAKLFAEYYREDLTAEQIYEKIIKIKPIKDAFIE